MNNSKRRHFAKTIAKISLPKASHQNIWLKIAQPHLTCLCHSSSSSGNTSPKVINEASMTNSGVKLIRDNQFAYAACVPVCSCEYY